MNVWYVILLFILHSILGFAFLVYLLKTNKITEKEIARKFNISYNFDAKNIKTYDLSPYIFIYTLFGVELCLALSIFFIFVKIFEIFKKPLIYLNSYLNERIHRGY